MSAQDSSIRGMAWKPDGTRFYFLGDNNNKIYEYSLSTAWNLTMMYGLPALEVPTHLTSNLAALNEIPTSVFKPVKNTIAYVVDGATDASLGFAARLMEQNIKVRVLDKKGLFNRQTFSRGSVVVSVHDNLLEKDKLEALIIQVSTATKSQVIAITQGLGEGDLPDIGSKHFKLLDKPQVAILSQSGINVEDLGSIWHMLDTELGIRHSHLNHEFFNSMDLRQYNVLVVPSRYYGTLSKANISALDNWVKNGGTLIVNGNSAKQLVKEEDFSDVVLLGDSFEKSKDYNTALTREWLALQTSISNRKKVNDHKVALDIWYPWHDEKALEPMDKDTLEKWEDWNKNFMPSGAIVAARTDQKHWLTYGVEKSLPVLTSNAPLFMAKEGVDAVVRYGVFVSNNNADTKQVGWATTPKGQDLYLRMSTHS